MKKFFVVMTDYNYPVAVEEYQLRGRAVLHMFVAQDFLEAVDIKNKWLKESGNRVWMAKATDRA